MPSATPGYTRNIIRRSLRELVDPSPTKKQVDQIWKYFKSTCAFCGRKLNRTNKDGHVDHLIPASGGGLNHMSNRVLACQHCNEKEKLDKDWKVFMKDKVSDSVIRKKRIDYILKWMTINAPEEVIVDEKTLASVLALTNKVVDKYSAVVDEIRTMNKK